MEDHERALAIVGVGAILPDAMDAGGFWNNLVGGRYSITETPADRWSIADYYDPDPTAPDKTYSKIGGWVRGFEFDWRKFRVPPKVAAAMDESQQWAVTIAAQALDNYGYPQRPLDTERTAVVLGTAMGGERHYLTTQRVLFPEYAHALEGSAAYAALPLPVQRRIRDEFHAVVDARIPPITEDSMPGELANIVSGRVANVLNLRGANFITDAACASSLAALDAAWELLNEHKAEAVITGGVDRNMGVQSFVKFCKIGALSAAGTRPFGKGADGFVMGEGSAAFLLKRLADAERDGDKIYAIVRGVGASSDGKGKGITAPNPIGQQLAARRAWQNAGLDPASALMVEAHGTSTRVGDVVEVDSLSQVFAGAPRQSIALGSVKSNIGHLKAGAGAAGLLKAVLSLYHKTIAPTLNAQIPNPDIPFEQTPFYLIHEPRAMTSRAGQPRRAGVSAYGFGGTNFHAVLEEYVPGSASVKKVYASAVVPVAESSLLPVRGILALGADSAQALSDKLESAIARAQRGDVPPRALPGAADVCARERLVIDFGDRDELLDRLQKARKAIELDSAQAWKALQAQGIFRGSGELPGKVAFLFPGQGSQYLNMGRDLVKISPAVAQVFAAADDVMTPILGRPLTDYIFFEGKDPEALKQAERALQQTAITQPAMLTLDIAILRLLGEYGFKPDMLMGHSLGEYAALIAAGVMPFADALEAAAARGAEMTKVSVRDNGWMAAVMAPYEIVAASLMEIDGYVVAANINSPSQCVIGGASKAVEQAIELFKRKGFEAQRIPVSHAFHTEIVAPASGPLRQVLDRLHVAPPQLPLIANVSGDFYPASVDGIKAILQQQIASPVQWVKGLETLYATGARVFVEVGPKKALKGFTDDVFAGKAGVISVFTNHPKTGELQSFNQALCGLYAAGLTPGAGRKTEDGTGSNGHRRSTSDDVRPVLAIESVVPEPESTKEDKTMSPYDRNASPLGSVVISGTGLGLPGAEKSVMDPDNALRILRGEQFVDLIPERFRQLMLDKQITRLVKAADGSGHFETITHPSEVIKLAGRPGSFDLAAEYGVPVKLVEALDITTQLAMAAGLDALREAGIPLVQTFKKTSKGTYLPDRWLLPEALRDETGIIFASAFPGGDRFADEFTRYYTFANRKSQLELLEDLRHYTADPETLNEINRRMGELRDQLEREPYTFDRRFLFRILSMGHSQFAEYIGARGPNTQVNAACASTAQAIGLAEDWIRGGRARRVIVVAGDDVSGDHLLEWVGAGFLATGAAATDDRVSEAALPFDRRRHGMLIGMGACALVVESEDAVRERGMRGIVELLASETNNSAFHGTRLDVGHIAQVMDNLVTSLERRFGLQRGAIAPQMVFMSHETFTPARGGSASAEVYALRQVFGAAANDIVVANTKGFTGHAMAVGVEDVIAAKILEYGIVPPVPNYKEVDPELGRLNLSRGGRYPVQYVLHLAAGFGSQIAMTFTRRIPGALDRVDRKSLYRRWLADVSGYERAETEVVKRVLRVEAHGPPPRTPAPSYWQYGTGPTVRTTAAGDGAPAPAPKRMVIPGAATSMPHVVAEPAPVVSLPPKAQPVPAGVHERVSAAPLAVPTEREARAPQPSPAVAAAPAPSPAGSAPSDDATEHVLDLVAAKTGYPREMLDLDLDLEADLGIDTVKQAEVFAAIREHFHISRIENLKLRDYPTLKHTIEFVRRMRQDVVHAGEDNPADDKRPTSLQEDRSASAVPVPLPAGTDTVAEQVLQIVAEKTGYPLEMLDPTFDLEADLGIDTVKQAETFAAIRARFDIPRREDLKLRDYPTLAHVFNFVRQMRPYLKTTGDGRGTSEVGTSKAIGSPAALVSQWRIEDADRIPRRVPVPVLRPALDWCKPTGVTLGADSRVIVALDRAGIGQVLVDQLQARGVTTYVIDEPLSPDALETRVKAWLSEGAIQGVYWLSALDVEPELETMDLATWREANRVRVKNLYTTMRVLYDSLSAAGTFLVCATRMGGLHGYGAEGALAPLGGAVTGFGKAYKRERGDVLVKAVDVGPDVEAHDCAGMLIAETLHDPGVVEVGYWNGSRFSISLQERPARDGSAGMTLSADTVFVVTGAAGGITSSIVADLAAASAGIFYLLDLVPAPEAGDPHIAQFRTDKDALKGRLIEEAKARGERPTPVQIEKQIFALERAEAALRAIESVERAGGKAFYHSVDLLDAAAVTAVVEQVRERHGRIDVLVHAAGLEISRTLADKDPKQFDLVFDVKADGFFNLLHAARGMPIGATVAFSSVAGRFGNAGQTDYSAANDLLCKLTSNLRRWRPQTRGIVIDWTAWAGIGMATRGSIPRLMQAAGIDTLPPESGVPTVRRELTASAFKGELVVAGCLGALTQELDAGGGLDVVAANACLAERKLLMVGKLKAASLYGGLEAETTLDPSTQPFLYDHQIEGTPLLPGVMGTEAFAELAGVLAPAYRVAAVENETFERPFKFHRMQPQTLYLNATVHPLANGDLLAHTVLKSSLQPPRPELPAQEKVHFSADVRLTRASIEKPLAHGWKADGRGVSVDRQDIYRVYFHGPAYRVLERAQVDGDEATGWLPASLPPDTNPEMAVALVAPRLVELCFQTAGIWQIKRKGVLALPRALDSVRVYHQPESANGARLFARVQAIENGTRFNAQVVDECGNVYVALDGYQTVELPGAVEL